MSGTEYVISYLKECMDDTFKQPGKKYRYKRLAWSRYVNCRWAFNELINEIEKRSADEPIISIIEDWTALMYKYSTYDKKTAGIFNMAGSVGDWALDLILALN